MNQPIKLTLWFLSCISIGLLLAYFDGIPLHAIRQTAFIALAIGLSGATIAWLVSLRRDK